MFRLYLCLCLGPQVAKWPWRCNLLLTTLCCTDKKGRPLVIEELGINSLCVYSGCRSGSSDHVDPTLKSVQYLTSLIVTPHGALPFSLGKGHLVVIHIHWSRKLSGFCSGTRIASRSSFEACAHHTLLGPS
ncbi:hypothetical protein BJV74DRAFT_488128 [Russula compacta]|nr:hypothetical protein BJV74DRAFT_488128 [Russula compacta]